jgi:putative membrane protein
MRVMRIAAIGALAALTVFSSGPAAVAVDGPAPTRLIERESVQAKLSSTGEVKQTRLYSQLTVEGDGEYTIVDPTSTRNLRNLQGFGRPAMSDGAATWTIDVQGATSRRTVADYTRELPLEIDVGYRLDGNEISPSSLVGRSGLLEATYTVRNITAAPTEVEYRDSKGVRLTETIDVLVPLAASFTTTLPAAYTDVSAPGAVAVGDGRGNTKISATLIMFEPLGAPEQTFSISANVADVVVPPATLQAVPVTIDQSPLSSGNAAYTDAAKSTYELAGGATQIDQNLTRLAKGAGDLLAGLIQLADGAQALNEGLGKAEDGSGKIADGLVSADDGGKELADGLGKLHEGSGKLSDGLGQANTGGGELATGLRALRDGSGKLSDGLGQADSGGKELADGLRALRDGSGKLSDGLGQADSGGKELAAGLGALRDGSGALSAGLSQANAGSQQLAGGLVQLEDGSWALSAGLSQANAGGKEVAGGAGQIAAGNASAADGAGQILAGLQQIEAGLGELDDAMPDALAGARALRAGVIELRAALGAPGVDGTVLDGLAQLAGKGPYAGAGLPLAKAGVEGVRDGLAGAPTKAQDAIDALTYQQGLLDDVIALCGGLTDPVEKGTCEAKSDGAKTVSQQVAGGLATSKAELTYAHGVLSQVAVGLSNAAVGADKLYAGVTLMASKVESGDAAKPGLKEGLTALVGGLTAAVDGIGKLSDGSTQATAGQTELKGGLDQLAAGAAQLATGSAALSGGLEQLDAGGQQLAAGTTAAAAGSAGLADGLGQLDTGGKELAAGAGKAADGGAALSGGLRQLSDGSKELNAGAGKAADGGAKLSDGLGQLRDGAGQLNAGLGDAEEGSGKLADGLGTAKLGGGQVADGAAQLGEKGTGVLASSVNDAHAAQNRNVALVKAMDERSRTAGMPAGAPEGAEASAVYSFELAGADGAGRENTTRLLLAMAALAGVGVLTGVRRRALAGI